MPIAIMVVISLALGYAAFQRGGVSPQDFNLCLLAVGTAATAHFLTRRVSGRRLSWAGRGALAVFFAFALLQLVPLPVTALHVLSPARAELVTGLAAVGPAPSSAPLSVIPEATWTLLLNFTGCLLIFLVVRDLAAHFTDRPWLVALPVIAIGVFESVLGLLQAYSSAGNGVASGTYNNRDHFAGFLEMCLPFAVLGAVAVMRGNRSRFESPAAPALKACVLLGAAAAIFLAIMMSLSRMGFMATMAAFFVVGAVAFSSRRTGWRRWAPVVGTGVLVTAAFVFLPTDALIARFSQLADEEISSDARAQIWRESTALIRAFPVFGCGLGGYESSFQRYKTVAPMYTVDYAHNDYLQFWAELGTIGFLAGLFFFVRLFFKTVTAAIGEANGAHRYRAQACLGALTAIALHSFVDFNLYVPATTMLLAWISGVAASSVYGEV